MSDDTPKIATLELTADADYGDIQSVVEAIAKSPGLEIESNQDSTYDISAQYE
jgi:hypothetical protein